MRKRSQTARAALGFVCGLAVLLAEGRVAATPAVVVSIETPPAVALGALSVEVQYDAALLTPLPAPPPELGVTVEPAEALVGRASIVMGAAPLPSRVALVVLSGEPGGISEVGDLLVLRMQRQAGQPGEGVLTLSAVEAYDRLGVAAPPPTVRVRLIEIDECGDGVLGPTELCEVGDSCCTNECQFAMAGSPCDDGIVCTTGDLCAGNAAQCLPGASDDAVCDNGLFCDGAERCDPGLGCQAGPAPDLDDQVSCTEDLCNEEADQILHTPLDIECDNALFCDGLETCDPVLDCQPGVAPALSDQVGCTNDFCDETNDVVLHTPVDSACDNGLFCDGTEICDPLLDCQPGLAPAIEDGISCTTDGCDEVNDRIVHTPVDSECDNGLFCDGAERCDALLDCQPGEAPALDDQVACTSDFCDELADQVTHAPVDASCDNGLFCDGAETCDPVLDCQPGEAPALSDGVGCTQDGCDETGDVVVHTPVDASCNNGLFCDGSERCDPQLDCQPGLPPVLSDGVGCTQDACDEAGDRIVHTPVDVSCDNGLFCDGSEFCDPQLDCQPGSPPLLSDGVGCTEDECDEAGDRIVHAAVDARCDNGLFCDGSEVCDPLLDCQPGVPPSLSDSVSCTSDACDEANDRIVHTPVDAFCNNQLFCDGVERCDALLGCRAGTPPELGDGVDCTDDVCDEAEDRIVHTAIDARCNDGLFCNGAEACSLESGCFALGPPISDDEIACTEERCDEDLDEILHVPVDLDCDDQNPCTADSCDALIGCTHVRIAECESEFILLQNDPAVQPLDGEVRVALALDFAEATLGGGVALRFD